MGRVMAIDYGTKRVGIAVSDPLKMIANGLDTLSPEQTIAFIKDYASKENLECIVIGEPRRMSNEKSAVEVHIADFIKKLTKALPGIKTTRADERFTSKIASSAMLAGGLRKKARQNKATVDKVSATIILQDYLNGL